MLDDQTQIVKHLKQLHMPTIRGAYEDTAHHARKESWSYEQYLLELLQVECDTRLRNRIARNLRESGLPPSKTFENFDQRRLSQNVAAHLKVLMDGSFVDRTENILAFGNPGSSKTPLLCAIGHELIRNGRRVLFTLCSQLVQDLLIAKRELTITKTLKRLSRYDAVIIDDLGYVQQSREEMEVLFTFLADRYEKHSVLLTSNLPFSQ